MFSANKFFGKGLELPPPQGAHFRVGDGQSSNFVLRLTDPIKINQARRQIDRIDPPLHVTGIIVKEAACWNTNYSYHYDPETVDFFEYSMEVCDATFQYTQEHLQEAGGAFLPGLRLCPWGSYLIEEVAPSC